MKKNIKSSLKNYIIVCSILFIISIIVVINIDTDKGYVNKIESTESVSGDSTETSETATSTSTKLCNSSLNANDILFIYVSEIDYSDVGKIATNITAIDNAGNIKSYATTDTKSIVDAFNPTEILLLADGLDSSSWYTYNSIDINTLRKIYKSTLTLEPEQKLNFVYNTAEQQDYNEKAAIYGYSYKNSNEFAITKYYSSINNEVTINNDSQILGIYSVLAQYL